MQPDIGLSCKRGWFGRSGKSRQAKVEMVVTPPLFDDLSMVRMGREAARDVADGIAYEYATREKSGRLMGIPLPSLDVTMPALELKYSFLAADSSCDETMREFFDLLKLVARMAEIRTMVWRLAKEVKKTQRRVNALEKVVIPDILETRMFIEGVLEEREREVFFVQKILKSRLLGDTL